MSFSFLHENSWKAHEKVTNDYVAKRVCAKRAIILCRLIAGRVGGYHRHELMDIGEDGRFDLWWHQMEMTQMARRSLWF